MPKKFILTIFVAFSGLSSAWAPLTLRKMDGSEAERFSDCGIFMPIEEGRPIAFTTMKAVRCNDDIQKVFGVLEGKVFRFIDNGSNNVSCTDGHLVLMVQKERSMALNQFRGNLFQRVGSWVEASRGGSNVQTKADILAMPVWVVSTGEGEAKESCVFLKEFLPEHANFPKSGEQGHGILYDARFLGAAWGNASSDAANINVCQTFPVLDLDGRENGTQDLKAHLCSFNAKRALWFGETYKEEKAWSSRESF